VQKVSVTVAPVVGSLSFCAQWFAVPEEFGGVLVVGYTDQLAFEFGHFEFHGSPIP
jgi:hypothetical protein